MHENPVASREICRSALVNKTDDDFTRLNRLNFIPRLKVEAIVCFPE